MLRNSWNAIKYFGHRYDSGIQRKDFDLTDRISLQDLGRIKSPSFSVPYKKAHKSIIFSFLHTIQNLQSIQIFKLTPNVRSSIILSKNFQRSSQEFRRSVPALVHVSFNFEFFFISLDNLLGPPFFITLLSPQMFFLFYLFEMGRFERLVKSSALIEMFKEKYHISKEVLLRYCSPEGLAFDREVGEIIIPMIAFIEGGMTILMGRITRDYLRNHRLCP